jgi:hypothetical protein
MRENVIRDVVTRLMTDDAFRQKIIEMPGSLWGEYDLSEDEGSVLFNMEIEGVPMQRLEQRLSASFGKSLMHDNPDKPDDQCGCCPEKDPCCYPAHCSPAK